MKLESYGLIGDMHTAALVGIDGSIDWLCLPRFDSDACCAALLGDGDNGSWRLAPAEKTVRAAHAYRPDTMILETEFETADGAARLVDFMPPDGRRCEVVRIVEGVRGRVAFHLHLTIRLDNGRTIPWVQHTSGGITAVGGPNALVLKSAVHTRGSGLATVADFTVGPGEKRAFVLAWHPSHERSPRLSDPAKALARTERYWKKWAARCTYRGEWREAVVRSLITLKALTYEPTGGIVAAVTTSLPEQLGGVRNWDYRYCWLRDATFTLYSFMQAGYTDEASAWIEWLLRAVGGDPSQLQVLYGAAGERRLTEVELPHLAGYEGSRPVRIGNAASDQFQLDIYGEVMDAMHLARTVGIATAADSWALQCHLVEFVEKHWMEPDDGIWEVRGVRRHFTHSKMMAWVAIDRAVKGVESFGLEGDGERWRRLRQTMHDEICRQGYNPALKAFTQFYGSDQLDASLLMMPLVGFLPATDARVVGTVEAIQRNIVADRLVYRYHPEKSKGRGRAAPGRGRLPPVLVLAGRLPPPDGAGKGGAGAVRSPAVPAQRPGPAGRGVQSGARPPGGKFSAGFFPHRPDQHRPEPVGTPRSGRPAQHPAGVRR